METNLIQSFIKGLQPETEVWVDEWADANIILPPLSAEPGPYRSRRTKYAIKIMRALSPGSTYKRIIFKKSSQVGGTQILLNWIGCLIAHAPGGILLVSPTDGNAKRNSKIRIEPMIRTTPVLRAKIQSSKIREGGNTVLQKDFPGGFLVMTGANSTADLKSLPARYRGYDEVDEYPPDLNGQGSVIGLGDARGLTYQDGKSFINSTPTLEDTSIIDPLYAETDQNEFHLPCPECSALQLLVFEQLRYEKGKYADVKYECSHCNFLIEEDKHKDWMLDNGDFVAQCPEKANPDEIGFFVNAMCSPWYKWWQIAQAYDKALLSEADMRVFNNTLMGRSHKQKGEQPDYNMVFAKRTDSYLPNRPPVEVSFLTAGADVQGDRIEVEIVGWSKGKRSYSIDYRVFRGDTAHDKVWQSLATVVNEQWVRADGLIMPLRLLCVDSGHNQSKVYEFARMFDISRVVPIKGGPPTQGVIIAAPRLVDYTRDGKKVGQVRSWNVGVSILKGELYGWLRLNPEQDPETKQISYPPGYCFFPREGHYSGVEYFKGLCSEQLEFTPSKGILKYNWVKKYPFNEPLDCRNYARAAFSILQGDRFEDHHYDLMAAPPAVKKPVKKKRDDDEKEWL